MNKRSFIKKYKELSLENRKTFKQSFDRLYASAESNVDVNAKRETMAKELVSLARSCYPAFELLSRVRKEDLLFVKMYLSDDIPSDDK